MGAFWTCRQSATTSLKADGIAANGAYLRHDAGGICAQRKDPVNSEAAERIDRIAGMHRR